MTLSQLVRLRAPYRGLRPVNLWLAVFVVGVLSLTFLVTDVRAQSSDDDAARHAEAVQTLVDDGEFENAIARVEAALKNHKKDERLLLLRGLVLVKLGKLDAAVKHYRKLNKRFRKNPEPGNNLAVVFRYQRRYGDAIDVFRSIIKRFPDYTPAYENLGDTYIEMANREYLKGLSISPATESLVRKSAATEDVALLAVGNTLLEREEMLARIAEGEKAIEELALINATAAAQSEALADPSDVIYGTLNAWVAAWSSRDIDQYIAHYSLEFVPDNGLSVADWLAQRTAIIERAGSIAIELEDIAISRPEVNLVTVSFVQNYQSDVLKTLARKSLSLRRYEDGKWLIVKEESRPL